MVALAGGPRIGWFMRLGKGIVVKKSSFALDDPPAKSSERPVEPKRFWLHFYQKVALKTAGLYDGTHHEFTRIAALCQEKQP
jgi:hypothetical protein